MQPNLRLMDQAYVKLETSNGIASIEFYHPQSNSLPGKILNELAETIVKAGVAKDSNCIVLKSAGEKAFCAGASFDELVAIENEQQGLQFFSGFAKVINAMRTCPKLIIGRVQGKAVGGGVGIASSMDYCLATTAASVKLSELAVGIGPFVVGPAVERKIGVSAFTELAIDASEWRSAEWAAKNGLYNAVYDSINDLDASVQLLANRIKNYSPEAMSAMKKTFWQGTENWDTLLLERAAISGRLVLSDFTRTAIQKFKSKP